ncbi:MAG: tRNA (adenosine(37)-N6)-dimethylallyltransferase MiaA [Taibaiella sp.]|jgi:tRNA dimethylallyltransferase
MGPTACGKSSLALEMARRAPFEIISVDSALVYKGMDIGTAKPTKAERAEIPHHLIDICDPKIPYSVADFIHDAKIAIDDIIARQKIPLLVGGTMMYFNALKTGLSTLPSSDPNIRLQLEKRMQAEGLNALYENLLRVDPIAAQNIHANDTQRILRALEVYEATGQSLSAWQKNSDKKALDYTIQSLAIMPASRETLHQNINQRFDTMLAQGFMNEMEYLFNRGDLSADLPSMRCVGYRQAWQYLSGEGDFAHMREASLAATRQLAKRQITWLRKCSDLSWFVPDCQDGIFTHCNL